MIKLLVIILWLLVQIEQIEEMRDIETDIVCEDQPVKRMVRPPIQTKFLDALVKDQQKQNKMTHGSRSSLNKKGFASQKQSETTQHHQSNLSKLSLNSTDQDSKEQFDVHLTEIAYESGLIFKGSYKQGKKTKGHFKFQNGFQYQGGCNDNHFEGQGSLIFPSGKVIFGLWEKSNLSSNAKIYYPTGQIYFGAVKDYKKHGNGQLYFNGNEKYIGQFNNGSITGLGTYFVDQKPVENGFWIDGEIVEEKNLQKLRQQLALSQKASSEQSKMARNKDDQSQIDFNDFRALDQNDIE